MVISIVKNLGTYIFSGEDAVVPEVYNRGIYDSELSTRRMTLLTKIIRDELIKSIPGLTQSNFPTVDGANTSRNNNIPEINVAAAVAVLANSKIGNTCADPTSIDNIIDALMSYVITTNTDPSILPNEEELDRIIEKLGPNVKAIFNALVPLINDCNSGTCARDLGLNFLSL